MRARAGSPACPGPSGRPGRRARRAPLGRRHARARARSSRSSPSAARRARPRSARRRRRSSWIAAKRSGELCRREMQQIQSACVWSHDRRDLALEELLTAARRSPCRSRRALRRRVAAAARRRPAARRARRRASRARPARVVPSAQRRQGADLDRSPRVGGAERNDRPRSRCGSSGARGPPRSAGRCRRRRAADRGRREGPRTGRAGAFRPRGPAPLAGGADARGRGSPGARWKHVPDDEDRVSAAGAQALGERSVQAGDEVAGLSAAVSAVPCPERASTGFIRRQVRRQYQIGT